MRNGFLPDEKLERQVVDYFSTIESRLGYSLLLKGVKHFGYYPKGREDISMREAQYSMMNELQKRLDLPSDSLILDAGCGEGETAMYLARKYGYRIRGIDILNTSLEKARRRSAKRNLEGYVEFRRMNFESLDFPDESFDGAYTMETLVHAGNYKNALQEFHRVLKRGGKLVLFEYSIPGSESIEVTPYQKKILEIVFENTASHSFRHFVHGRFPEILEEAGFTRVVVEDITQRVMPMVKRFYKLAFLPYQLVRAFGLREMFINTTIAFEFYRNLRQSQEFWRYNIITATKP